MFTEEERRWFKKAAGLSADAQTTKFYERLDGRVIILEGGQKHEIWPIEFSPLEAYRRLPLP